MRLVLTPKITQFHTSEIFMTQSFEKLEIIIKLSFEKYSQTSACDWILIHTITQFYMYKNHHKAEF